MSDTRYFAYASEFEAVADAIREKNGTSSPLEWPNDFTSAISNIETEKEYIKTIESMPIVTINDAMSLNADDVSVAITPVQSGSGDPSPTNIRPISGWTGANVYRTGINVWDEECELGAISTSTGQQEASSTALVGANYIQVKPSTSYYVKTSDNIYLFYYKADKSFIQYHGATIGNAAFTTPENCCYIRIGMRAAYGTTYNHDISINYSSTDHDYHAYAGDTYSVSWQSEAGTVYGGTLDLTTGKLTVDRATITLDGTQSISKSTSQERFYVSISGTRTIDTTNQTTDSSVVCDKMAATTWGSLGTKTDGAWCSPLYGNGIAFKAPDIASSIESWTTYFTNHPTQFTYALNSSIEYTLTPQDIAMLRGNNNVWVDCGDTTIKYFTIEAEEVAVKAIKQAEKSMITRQLNSIYSNSEVTFVGSYAFAEAKTIINVDFPLCKTIHRYAFNSCTKLNTISFPNCKTISSFAFNYCIHLDSINFPNCDTINSNAFNSCRELTNARFPNCSIIGSYAFASCYQLLSLYFLGSKLISLGLHAFVSTPMGGYTSSTSGVVGKIYVPASLLQSYKSRTNWSTWSSYISGVNVFDIGSSRYCTSSSTNTWATWVNGKHNLDQFFIDGSYIRIGTSGYVCISGSSQPVTSTNTIADNGIYDYYFPSD